MAGRVRITNISNHTGSSYNFLAGSSRDSTRIIQHERISDTSGYVFHEPLEIVHFKASGGIINGKTLSTEFSSFPCDWLDQPYNDMISDPFAPPEDFLYTKLLAKSNPSKEDISLPNFIFELKDLPRMIKEAGELIITNPKFISLARRLRSSVSREIANKWLSYKFGYAPLLSDARSLCKQSDSISKRLNRLKNLQEGSRETVLRKLATTNGTIPGIAVMQSLGGFFLASQITTHKHEYRGYVTWVLNNPGSLPTSPEQLANLASRISFKRELDFEVVWDMIPWSWLIDYFTNIGDITSLTNNRLDVHPENVRLMRQSTVSVSTSKSIDTDAECSPATLTWNTKSRWVPTGIVKPTFYLGALTSSQMGILGALMRSRSR